MPDGKPTKAPLIIFGGVLFISIVCVSIVLFTHARRTEPYLDTKMRRIKLMARPDTPAVAAPSIPVVRPTTSDAGVALDAAPEL